MLNEKNAFTSAYSYMQTNNLTYEQIIKLCVDEAKTKEADEVKLKEYTRYCHEVIGYEDLLPIDIDGYFSSWNEPMLKDLYSLKKAN